MGQKARAIDNDALTALQQYVFPGNIRELKNLLGRALIFSGGEEIRRQHLDFQRAMRQSQGNISEAARLLGVNRATLYRFINSAETQV